MKQRPKTESVRIDTPTYRKIQSYARRDHRTILCTIRVITLAYEQAQSSPQRP